MKQIIGVQLIPRRKISDLQYSYTYTIRAFYGVVSIWTLALGRSWVRFTAQTLKVVPTAAMSDAHH